MGIKGNNENEKIRKSVDEFYRTILTLAYLKINIQ